MTKKPSKIVKLEKAYNITLEKVDYDDVDFWKDNNCYDVDEDWNVFALNLRGNAIENLTPLLELKALKFLNLSYNSIASTDELKLLSKLEILDLSDNEITSFNFSALSNIRVLKLNDNNISNIESQLELHTLEVLHLSNNGIHTINDLSSLTKLKKLDLRKNKIESIGFLDYLSGLEILDLGINTIQDISVLSNLVNLRALHLNANNLKNVEPLNELHNLEHLRLAGNNISDISFLNELRSLKYLDLSYNQISDITDLDGLIQLETLDISGNSISDLLYLSGLVYLKELDLGENKILDISYLRYLKRLKYLYLRDNKVSKIDALLELEQLEFLILNSNSLTNIEGIGELSNINYLDLADNQISDLKPLSSLIEIEGLNLNNNQITDIGPLVPLLHLRRLYLGNNMISSVEGLSKLSQLEVLILGANTIETIDELFLLPKIEALNLEDNKISSIKVQSYSNNLTSLSLNNNIIADLQSISSILKIETLVFLEISNNPILEILDLRTSSTKDHLELLKSKLKEQEDVQKKITLPIKVMLLGNHASGKSTFLEYLQTGNIKNRDKSTPILKIEDYYSETQKKGTLPKAIIYDFGGQDYYHGMYQAFFSLDSINLLLWNKKTDKNAIRPDSDNLNTRDFSKRYWLAQLQYAFNRERRNYKEESDEPTFLVQTYADTDEKESWINKKETQKVTNEFYLSLSENKEVKSQVNDASLNYLKASLLHEIERKQIEEEKPIWYKPFLNYIIKRDTANSTKLTTIIKHYNRDNLTEDEKQQFLEVDLEQLALKGMILYYKHDKELKDIAWLNPSATVEYIHETILNKALVKREKGKLETKDWKKICPDSRLERLLIIEKVIFFDKDNAHYIIPNYLPLAQDDEHYNLLSFGFIEPNFILKFKYFIPFGIINQLICRFGNNPDYKTFWRDQLIFTYKKAKVFIKLSFETLTISVFIQRNKPEELEQELFDIILRLYNNDTFEMSLSDRLSEEIATIIERTKYYRNIPLESISNYELEHLSQKTEAKDKLKNLRFIRKGTNSIKNSFEYNSPEDMYLSVDGQYFVHHKTLENSELTQTKISAFPFNKKGEIDDTKPKEQSSIIYTNFTNNDKIKQMKKIFISYSRKDVDYKNELKKHLGMLSLFDIADAWSCEDISIGKWDTQIQKELEESDLIIYMLSANFFSSRYIIEKEVANIMKEIEEGKQKDILCVIVSDFVGVETLKNPNDDRPTTALQNALLELAAHQYLPYDTITNKASNNTEEKIIPLKVHTNRNTIESALTQIVNKVREKLQ